jgi:hypothetical protein
MVPRGRRAHSKETYEVKAKHSRIVRAAITAAVLIAPALQAWAQPPRNPFDIPFPMPTPPYTFVNQHGDEIQCSTSPYQRVDLGMVGPMHIYAGDHCSVPSNDPLSKKYKEVFSRSCDLHDICYFAPGNQKGFCDDMVKWHWDHDCDHAYSNALGRDQCKIASKAWRAGLNNALSNQYWVRSQDWGRHNCHIVPRS